jgi:hypothetical protein
MQELYGHGQCEELALELCTAVEVEEYLGRRFGQSPAITALSHTTWKVSCNPLNLRKQFAEGFCRTIFISL